MDRSSRPKINKETEALNDTIDQIDLIDIYGESIPKQQITLLLKCARNILQDKPILGHKSSLSKFKKIEIISSISSDHNTMRLEINYREKNINTNTWRMFQIGRAHV